MSGRNTFQGWTRSIALSRVSLRGYLSFAFYHKSHAVYAQGCHESVTLLGDVYVHADRQFVCASLAQRPFANHDQFALKREPEVLRTRVPKYCHVSFVAWACQAVIT